MDRDVFRLFSLQGKVALITGSTRGIGRAIADGFCRAGARVWIHGLEVDAGQTLAEELSGKFVGGNLGDPQDVRAIAATLAKSEGKLDVLVNNAATFVPMTVDALDSSAFERVLRVNLNAPVELTYELLPLLRAGNGTSVINVTSIHDTVPHPNDLPYCISKAALAMFTRSAALDLAKYHIRVNNLAPGAVETDINRQILDSIGRDRFRDRIPARRVARVDEMVGPALFLASDASSYLTGATLYADGGYLQNLVRYDSNQ